MVNSSTAAGGGGRLKIEVLQDAFIDSWGREFMENTFFPSDLAILASAAGG